MTTLGRPYRRVIEVTPRMRLRLRQAGALAFAASLVTVVELAKVVG